MNRFNMGRKLNDRFLLEDYGAAIIEFALALPLLALLLFGTAEVLYYLRLTQQMEKTVQMTGGIIAQMTRISDEDFDLFFGVADDLLGPGPKAEQNRIMRIRQYGCPDQSCGINWYRDGAGKLKAPDAPFGRFPSHVQMDDRESAVHVCLWLRYQPLIGRTLGIGGTMLRREAYFKTSKDYPLAKIVEGKRP